MRENFLNMTIKEKPLEEDMFSLPITQLKTKGITQCFFFPQGQAGIGSHLVSFDEEPRWDGICGVGVRKEEWSHQLCPCALQATQHHEPLHPFPTKYPQVLERNRNSPLQQSAVSGEMLALLQLCQCPAEDVRNGWKSPWEAWFEGGKAAAESRGQGWTNPSVFWLSW